MYTIEGCMSEGELAELVRAGDAAFEADLEALAGEILTDGSIRLLGLTGPTCSGKTTAAAMLTRALEAEGRAVHVISIDDFYFGKEILLRTSREKGRTEPDYDSPDTIDVELMRAAVRSLLSGRETRMPRFNFRTGQRESGELLRPRAGDLFLFEGIQILYPQVDALLRQEGYYSFCVCPQSAIAAGGEVFLPNEIRLMRRLVRDVIYRAAAPSFTFFLWNSVRENEEKNIFPYIGTCNRTVDSTMPYEIGLLKPYLERYLTGEWVGDFWQEADGILARLADVQPVPDGLIQPDSLYKEFI
ncbi:MAG: hypothetical protein SOZ51_03700 [Eubacteriales bacterium]|nr:hypothetical protein [Eubacteriales bacterium]